MKDIVLCSDEGLAVRIGGGPAMSLPWSEVARVSVHVVAGLTAPVLVAGVEDNEGHVVELNQTQDGWPEFMTRIASLAGLSPAELGRRIDGLSVSDPPRTLFPTA